jgi:hypothetical protein
MRAACALMPSNHTVNYHVLLLLAARQAPGHMVPAHIPTWFAPPIPTCSNSAWHSSTSIWWQATSSSLAVAGPCLIGHRAATPPTAITTSQKDAKRPSLCGCMQHHVQHICIYMQALLTLSGAPCLVPPAEEVAAQLTTQYLPHTPKMLANALGTHQQPPPLYSPAVGPAQSMPKMSPCLCGMPVHSQVHSCTQACPPFLPKHLPSPRSTRCAIHPSHMGQPALYTRHPPPPPPAPSHHMYMLLWCFTAQSNRGLAATPRRQPRHSTAAPPHW